MIFQTVFYGWNRSSRLQLLCGFPASTRLPTSLIVDHQTDQRSNHDRPFVYLHSKPESRIQGTQVLSPGDITDKVHRSATRQMVPASPSFFSNLFSTLSRFALDDRFQQADQFLSNSGSSWMSARICECQNIQLAAVDVGRCLGVGTHFGK